MAFVVLLEDKLFNYIRKKQTQLSNLFGTKEMLKLEPHLTIKYKFEINKITPFENYFDRLVKSIKPFKIQIKKINYFGTNVAFLDVEKNNNLTDLHLNIVNYLGKNYNIKPNEYEGYNFHFHATLAYKDLSKEIFFKIKDYLKNEKPNFEYTISKLGIYLLLSPEDRWFVYKSGLLL